MPEVLISTFLRWIQLAHNAQICSPASTAKTAQSALLQQSTTYQFHRHTNVCSGTSDQAQRQFSRDALSACEFRQWCQTASLRNELEY